MLLAPVWNTASRAGEVPENQRASALIHQALPTPQSHSVAEVRVGPDAICLARSFRNNATLDPLRHRPSPQHAAVLGDHIVSQSFNVIYRDRPGANTQLPRVPEETAPQRGEAYHP